MRPLTKAERVAFARCWGLWVRWLRDEKIVQGVSMIPPDRSLLYRLWAHIREEMTSDE